MQSNRTDSRPKVVPWHGEGRSLFYVVVPHVDDPVATFDDRRAADFVVDLLGVVGSRDFLPVEVALAVAALTRDPDLDPEEVLERASDLLGGFGVEHVAGPGDTGALDYVNMGDTYAGTLAHDGADFVVTSWGDWYEGAEDEHAEETGERRCPYCGEWGEPEQDNLCSSCGNALD